MSDDDFAHRLRAERMTRFGGSKKAAYTFVGVNSGTWDRAEAGESLKEHTRIKIERALWPEGGTEGARDRQLKDLLLPLLAVAWDEGYMRGTLDATSDLEPADNPYGVQP